MIGSPSSQALMPQERGERDVKEVKIDVARSIWTTTLTRKTSTAQEEERIRRQTPSSCPDALSLATLARPTDLSSNDVTVRVPISRGLPLQRLSGRGNSKYTRRSRTSGLRSSGRRKASARTCLERGARQEISRMMDLPGPTFTSETRRLLQRREEAPSCHNI